MTTFSPGEVVAIIPARGGSKGVPGKNLQKVGGVPLVARAVIAALAAGIERVIVSTDDERIAAAATAVGGEAMPRPAAIAGDTATSESALIDVLDRLASEGAEPRVLAFLQATSPFIDPAALGAAVARVASGADDSVLSAFPTYAFIWRETPEGAEGVNHSASYRPRRQDREVHWQETGAFYVMDVAGFRAAGHRFFGRIGLQEVPEGGALEIDDRHQLDVAGRLAPLFGVEAGPIDVDAVVTDFDGVHTDDAAIVGVDGLELVRVSRADGLGVERLRQAGVPVLILSKERHPVVAARAQKLGVDVLQAVDDKASALLAWSRAAGVPLERVAYVGNDVNDAPALALVGWPVVPADANPAVKPIARVVLEHDGGRGAVRELAERVLAAKAAMEGRR